MKALAPGIHRVRFESVAEANPPGGRPRRLWEICEARFQARSDVLYVLTQELISVRGKRTWRHQLSSYVYDDERERPVGECICRAAPEP